jgi:hypothetical protein
MMTMHALCTPVTTVTACGSATLRQFGKTVYSATDGDAQNLGKLRFLDLARRLLST